MKLKIHSLGHKYVYFVLITLFIVSLSLITQGCADDPTSLGIQFVPPGETTGVKIFDSYTDTMSINLSGIRRNDNTSSSLDLLVGQSGSFNSKGLIKFNSITADYDSAVVNSATLKLKYRNYYYPGTSQDSLGQIAFDILKIEQNLSFGRITLDSVNNTSFGTTPMGSYTGSPTGDTQEVDIPLSTSLVKDWLEYAADTSYAAKNYGIVLSPTAASNVIKGFYSGKESSDVKPALQVIVTKNNDVDTLLLNETETLFLATGDLPVTDGSFIIQGGISYLELFKFVTNKIPSTATINDAQFILTLDAQNSIISNQTQRKILGYYATDSSASATEGEYSAFELSSQYVMRITLPFQRWIQGQTNYGLLLAPSNRSLNLDRFAFFNMNAADPNKRPRIIIRYTPRVIP